MFDIGWSEMAIIVLIALIVIGPKDLPQVARTVGRWVAKGRAMAREFQRAIEDMAKEAELDTVKKEIEKIGSTNLAKTIEKTVDPTGELGKAFDPTADAGKGTAGKVAASKPQPKATPAETTAVGAAAASPAVGAAAATSEAGVASTAATPSPSASPPAPPSVAVPPSPAVPVEAQAPERATVPAEPS